jgi:hypothetical protein
MRCECGQPIDHPAPRVCPACRRTIVDARVNPWAAALPLVTVILMAAALVAFAVWWLR